MIYGCIGEKLAHSFSAEIHGMLGGEPYELREIPPEGLADFFRARAFRGVNVTIPYKQVAIPFLDELSDAARAMGAVNTVVNRGGKLTGYNTDYDGMLALIQRMGLELSGKKALILGTGGTAGTARAVCRSLGAAAAIPVSRAGREGAVSYPEAARLHEDADCVINATPCGMYPRLEEAPLSLDPFPRLRGVIDAVYNPLRTRLVLDARQRGIPAEGGLYMLVSQAVRAAEIFRDTRYPPGLTETIYRRVLKKKENIVLIGMPGSGKSALCRALAARLRRPARDIDRIIEEKAGLPIPEIFRRFGEERFRRLESEIVRGLMAETGLVIATGGGTVLRRENVDALRMNGRLFLLQRDLAALSPAADHPLSDTQEKLEKLYEERAALYRAAADEIVLPGKTPEETAADIESR